MTTLAALYVDTSQLDKAEPLLRVSLERRERIMGVDHPQTAESAHNLASLLGKRKKHAEAADLYRRVIAIRSSVLGAAGRRTMTSRNNLAMQLHALGKPLEAEQELRELIRLNRAKYSEEHWLTGVFFSNLGHVLAQEKRYQQHGMPWSNRWRSFSANAVRPGGEPGQRRSGCGGVSRP